MDDVEVLGKVLAGDTEAFRLLVERYEKPVWRFALGLLGDVHAAEDAAQDAFVSAYESLGSFDPAKGAFSTWLFTIARNRCLSLRRRAVPEPVRDLPERLSTETPLSRLESRDFMQRLDQALASLPPGQKTAFVLCELAGLSPSETAAVEGVDPSTLRSRLSRAKAAIRSVLGAYAGGEG